ncbi:N-formylglutamate amidohydrolase [Flavobacterium sp.]|uniref:N-formylglutamate amidohydrolase n=1 Tax=Flavobacterium sp. TaxID=239 RepID=UPI0025CC3BD9|nr:N-formylglutamate amidohydrolase [Flavobacterium sp.]
MKKLVLHIPHSSTEIPLLDGYVSSHDEIQKEIIKLTDWYTDDLFDSQVDDKIVALFSRIFCDVERFADDELEVMSKFGMGVLYEKFDNGNQLRVVTPDLKSDVLNNYYWVHHTLLSKAVKTSLEQTKSCLILDCHSFPSSPLTRALVQDEIRPDFNIGTDSFHTPQHIIDASINYFETKGYTLGVDTPYSGSIVPMEYYQKEPRVTSIMLEVNRRLYLKENTNEKSEGYESTKEIVQGYIKLLKLL